MPRLCSAVAMLSAADTERLNELPNGVNMAIENDCCQFLPGHSGPHMFVAQWEEVPGEDSPLAWWVQWEPQEVDGSGYELVRGRACGAEPEGNLIASCELPMGHEGPHPW